MENKDFFDEPTVQSQIKIRIVKKYFYAWARVIFSVLKRQKRDLRLGFFDLFAGPGVYDDGTKSTPIEILEIVIENDELSKNLVTFFNDKDSSHVSSLRNEVDKIPDINKLGKKPIIQNSEVGQEIIKDIRNLGNFPILFFIDPWGYKGLTIELIESVVENWGCDCIFFFNFNRINAGLNNDKVREHMNSIFGEKNVDRLRLLTKNCSKEKREKIIIEEVVNILCGENGERYVLPFCFKNSKVSRTSHYLFFISKNFKGYEIMKDIMAKESSDSSQGVATFSYCLAEEEQPKLFKLSKPLDELEQMLIDEFSGTEIDFNNLYREHSVGRRFIKKNYKEILLEMQQKKKLEIYRKRGKIRKNSVPDDSIIKFH